MRSNESPVPWQRRPGVMLLTALALLDLGLAGIALARRAGREVSTEERVASVFQVLERDGLAGALDALQDAADVDSLVLRDGHQIAHSLGRRAVVASGGAVITQCSPQFASGCYHGVVEGFLHGHGRIDMGALEALCVAVRDDDRPRPGYECVHGLGHGLLGAVELDARAALGHCDMLTTPGFDASCRAGVFMEAIHAALDDATSPSGHGSHHAMSADRLALDAEDPYAPCDRFDGEYASACWLFQGFVILRARGFDTRAALRTCDTAPGGRSGACYESIGHQLAGLFQRDDRWMVKQCAMGQRDLAPRCAGGAALALGAADWSGGRVGRFCAAVPAEWKRACYDKAAGVLRALASPWDHEGWPPSVNGSPGQPAAAGGSGIRW